MGSSPDAVELLHDFADYCSVVGDNAGLEISFVLAFGPHAGAGQIGAAGVGKIAVNNHGFEMNSRTQDSLHALYQIWVLVEILTKGRPRLFGVQQSYLHTSIHQIGQDLKERHHPAALIDMKVFQVGRRYPNELPGLSDSPANHLLVDIPVCNVLKHSD